MFTPQHSFYDLNKLKANLPSDSATLTIYEHLEIGHATNPNTDNTPMITTGEDNTVLTPSSLIGNCFTAIDMYTVNTTITNEQPPVDAFTFWAFVVPNDQSCVNGLCNYNPPVFLKLPDVSISNRIALQNQITQIDTDSLSPHPEEAGKWSEWGKRVIIVGKNNQWFMLNGMVRDLPGLILTLTPEEKVMSKTLIDNNTTMGRIYLSFVTKPPGDQSVINIFSREAFPTLVYMVKNGIYSGTKYFLLTGIFKNIANIILVSYEYGKNLSKYETGVLSQVVAESAKFFYGTENPDYSKAVMIANVGFISPGSRGYKELPGNFSRGFTDEMLSQCAKGINNGYAIAYAVNSGVYLLTKLGQQNNPWLANALIGTNVGLFLSMHQTGVSSSNTYYDWLATIAGSYFSGFTKMSILHRDLFASKKKFFSGGVPTVVANSIGKLADDLVITPVKNLIISPPHNVTTANGDTMLVDDHPYLNAIVNYIALNVQVAAIAAPIRCLLEHKLLGIPTTTQDIGLEIFGDSMTVATMSTIQFFDPNKEGTGFVWKYYWVASAAQLGWKVRGYIWKLAGMAPNVVIPSINFAKYAFRKFAHR